MDTIFNGLSGWGKVGSPGAYVSACREPDISVSGVALANGLNANQVHRWMRERGVEPAQAGLRTQCVGRAGPYVGAGRPRIRFTSDPPRSAAWQRPGKVKDD